MPRFEPAPFAANVVIVGAGLGGLASAIAITEAGHRVTVLEAGTALAEIGNGIQLGPQSVNVLKRWGLDEELSKVASATQACKILRYTGDRILAAVDDFRDWLQSSYGSPLYALRRTELQRALHRKALDVGARFRMAATVAAIDPATGIVTLKSGETIDADLVIGADGIHSVARNALVGRPDPAIPTGELAYRIVLQTDSLKDDPELVEMIVDHPSCLYIHFGPDAHTVMYRLGDGNELNMVLAVPDDLPPRVSRQKGNLAEMRVLFDGWDPRLQRLLARVSDVEKWRLRSHPGLSSWHSPEGKLLLIGDAVHPMLPYMAAGANSALMDGVVLGECLRRARSLADIPTALEVFEAINKPRGEWTVRKSLQQRSLFNLHDGPEQEQRDRDFACPGRRGDYPFFMLSRDIADVLNGFQPYDEVDRRWDALAAEARARREGGARS